MDAAGFKCQIKRGGARLLSDNVLNILVNKLLFSLTGRLELTQTLEPCFGRYSVRLGIVYLFICFNAVIYKLEVDSFIIMMASREGCSQSHCGIM